MRYYSEKSAKDFLKKEGFEILKSVYIKKFEDIKVKTKNLNFPIVAKIFGKKIIHKSKIGGVKLNLKSYEEIFKVFEEMKKINGFEGVVVQKQVKGKEIFLGLKKTHEFGYAIGFGTGGVNVEQIKDINFRIAPLSKKEIKGMINDTKISKELSKNEKNSIEKNLILLQNLSKKYPKISELDINPLILNKNFSKIIDARMVWK